MRMQAAVHKGTGLCKGHKNRQAKRAQVQKSKAKSKKLAIVIYREDQSIEIVGGTFGQKTQDGLASE